MNRLDQMIRAQYDPFLAIVAYRYDPMGGDTEYYLESHEISASGAMLEGRPLKTETIAGMVNAFKDKHQQEAIITGAIPKHLLHYTPTRHGDYTLIWHRPAQQRMMYFTPELGLKPGLAMVPPTLFLAGSSHLRVWALASDRRPGLSTKVFDAPFHNVSSDGRVCLGSAKVRLPATKTFENLIAYWEEMFWGSKFSAVHNDKAVAGGMNKLWKTQLARKTRPFPLDRLKETKRTYKTIIDGK